MNICWWLAFLILLENVFMSHVLLKGSLTVWSSGLRLPSLGSWKLSSYCSTGEVSCPSYSSCCSVAFSLWSFVFKASYTPRLMILFFSDLGTFQICFLFHFLISFWNWSDVYWNSLSFLPFILWIFCLILQIQGYFPWLCLSWVHVSSWFLFIFNF